MLANIQGRLMKIARRILLVLVLVAEFAAAPANATIISAGSYNFNLNFTAAIPYSWANVQVMIASLLTGQHFSITIFPDLNEGGLAIGPETIAGPSNLLTVVYRLPEEELADICYIFESRPTGIVGEIVGDLERAFDDWRARHETVSRRHGAEMVGACACRCDPSVRAAAWHRRCRHSV